MHMLGQELLDEMVQSKIVAVGFKVVFAFGAFYFVHVSLGQMLFAQ
jgi:hypothetical protein